MNIVFMGTPISRCPCLQALLDDGHRVSLVVTQADKPKGRGHRLTPPPVKELALSRSIPVYQPMTLRTEEAAETIAAAQPDLIVVVAYGRILPQAVLSLPPRGCINVHASLLPRYRGAAPIQWAILNGETETGVTTMQMDAGLDTGDMLLSCRRPIPPDMTAGELFDALSKDGAALLSRTLQELENATLQAVPQPEDGISYAPMIDKSLSPLDWSRPAAILHNQVRGLQPWPAAVTAIGRKPDQSAPQPCRRELRSGVGHCCEAESLYGILRGSYHARTAGNSGGGLETHGRTRLFSGASGSAW